MATKRFSAGGVILFTRLGTYEHICEHMDKLNEDTDCILQFNEMILKHRSIYHLT